MKKKYNEERAKKIKAVQETILAVYGFDWDKDLLSLFETFLTAPFQFINPDKENDLTDTFFEDGERKVTRYVDRIMDVDEGTYMVKFEVLNSANSGNGSGYTYIGCCFPGVSKHDLQNKGLYHLHREYSNPKTNAEKDDKLVICWLDQGNLWSCLAENTDISTLAESNVHQKQCNGQYDRQTTKRRTFTINDVLTFVLDTNFKPKEKLGNLKVYKKSPGKTYEGFEGDGPKNPATNLHYGELCVNKPIRLPTQFAVGHCKAKNSISHLKILDEDW